MPRKRIVKPEEPMITSCSFDLECSSLDGDFGVILCGVIKPAGQKPKVFRLDELSKTWETRRSNDYPVVKAIVDELGKYDIVAAHFGTRYDFPFLRTRMLAHDMGPLKQQKIIDPWAIARRHLKFGRNTLDRITQLFDCNTKTSVDLRVWARAMLDGDRRAMNYIVEHCVEDVKMLEQVVRKLKPYCRQFDSWGSFF